MLGWDVGTFEFLSDQIVAQDYAHAARLKMRTGGSVGKVGAHLCHRVKEGNGHYWDMSSLEHKKASRLPVKFRYRSPVVFEFKAGRTKPSAYAVLWLQHLVDNEPTDIDLPIWKTSAPSRLTQNYVTEKTWSNKMPGLEDLEVVGRLKLRGRFKAGMDESHEAFVSDNDSRETYATWEACLAEGVRQHVVDKELPERVQALHEKSLTEGRDLLKQTDDAEKEKWLTKDGTNWSGAFGEDPEMFVDENGRKKAEPGQDTPVHDPRSPSSDNDSDDDSDSDSSSDLGVRDADTSSQSPIGMKSMDTQRTARTGESSAYTSGELGEESSLYSPTSKGTNRQDKRSEERKQRGLMQWKPARNLKFAKDEGKLGLRKIKNKLKGGLDGRQPGVETETGT